MRLFDFVSVKLSLCLILGIWIGYHIQPNTGPIAIILVILILVLAWSKKKQRRGAFPHFGALAFLTTVVLGMFVISLGLPKNQPHHFLNHKNDKSPIRLKITEVLKPSAYSDRYYAEVLAIANKTASGDLILYIQKDSLLSVLSVGDELLAPATIEALKSSPNPHQFNFRAFLQKQGVYGQLRLKQGQWISPKKSSWSVLELATNFRSDLIAQLEGEGFGSQELGVIQALLLGQRNDISEDIYSNYKDAGAVHILAVSGLHVGILLLLLQFLLCPLERLPKGKTLTLIISVGLLWGYAFIAGLSPSIVRAVTMFSFLAYALYLNRPTNTFNILALSLFLILLVRPLFVFQIGFQMSYAAVFAILWIYPKLQQFWSPKLWLVRKTWQLLSVSVAAQLGVLPLSLFYFHQFPGLFFISNLIIVPFLGAILGIGMVVLVLSYFNVLPLFMVSFYNSVIQVMNTLIGWVAQQEAFLFTEIPFDALQVVIGYGIVIALVLGLLKTTYRHVAFFLVSLALFIGYTGFQKWRLSSQEEVVLIHQNRNSIVLHRKGSKLHVLSKKPDTSLPMLKKYCLGERIASVNYGTLLNSYTFEDKRLLVIDSSGIYPPSPSTDMILLSHSPRVHLDRLIDSLKPKLLLADGSNYKSDIARWQQTCLKRKLPFHYTGEKGAYFF